MTRAEAIGEMKQEIENDDSVLPLAERDNAHADFLNWEREQAAMKDETRYVCPKCGHALKFEMVTLPLAFPRLRTVHFCQCSCPHCGGMAGRGDSHKEAWEKWKQTL